MAETRYCSNCRAELPAHATTCPACDVYAGEVYDGRAPAQVRSRRRRSFFTVMALLAIVAGVGAVVVTRPDFIRRFTPKQLQPAVVEPPAPVRVVRDRPGGARQSPGAKITEPEAILTLRRALAASPEPVKSECLAITSQGFSDGAWNLTAFNHCDSTRLGRWKVDAKSGELGRK